MLKKPIGMERDTSWEKTTIISDLFSCSSLLDISAGKCQRALVDEESRMDISHMGTHNRSETVKVQGSPFTPTP
jgi:hypothetical protein